MMPDAARSCQNPLTFTGMAPTAARCMPAEATRPPNHFDRLIPRSCCSASRSRPTRPASSTMRRPAVSIVALNARPEKSSNVPSSLNATRHQVWSGVVTIERSVPTERNAMASPDRVGPVNAARRSSSGMRETADTDAGGGSAIWAIGSPVFGASHRNRAPRLPSLPGYVRDAGCGIPAPG